MPELKIGKNFPIEDLVFIKYSAWRVHFHQNQNIVVVFLAFSIKYSWIILKFFVDKGIHY